MKYSIGRNLVITDGDSNCCRDALVIRQGNAFAPAHPTTELCLKLLERTFAASPVNSILDVGCGTGILALACLKLGAKRALALDISRSAMLVTRENAFRNHLEERIDLIQGSIQSVNARFDLIVANLHFSTLVGMAGNFRELLNANGTLIISGFFDMEFYHLDRALANLGFRRGELLYKDYVMVDLPPSMSSTFGGAQYFRN